MIQRSIRLAACALLTFAACACSSDPDKLPPTNPFKPEQQQNSRLEKLAADRLYHLAREALDASDFASAISRYDQLILRHPFTDYATQGEMERIYAYLRNYQAEEATTATDRFLREHPRHPHADYVQYLRGLINASRDQSLLDFIPGLDPSQGDVTYSRRAFDDFALLIQKYPNSRYNADARLRMIDLRNRIAASEYSVVDFYVRRGAWLAAAKRAERIITDYPGAPATLRAMTLLERCYDELGLKNQAEDLRKIKAAQKAAG